VTNTCVLALYILCLVSGASAVSMIVLYYVRTKDRVLLTYLILYAFLSLKVLSWIVDTYAEILGKGVPGLPHYLIAELSIYCVLWALPLFFNSFFKVPFRKTANLAFVTVALGFAAWDAFSLLAARTLPDTDFDTNVFGIVLLAAIAYSLIVGFFYRRRLDRPLQRKIASTMLVLFTAFLPCFVLDSIIIENTDFVFSSLFYLAWNVATLVFIARNIVPVKIEMNIDASALDRADLTKREIEVLRLLARGLSYREIADTLFVSLATAKTHIHNIYSKMGTKNRHKLLASLGGRSDA
jgi:DNA-binding CsgD family transcriptional regulator